MPLQTSFKVGDRVVYPAHGMGEIIAEEKQQIGGIEIGVFVISFLKEKMTLRVPVKRANAVGLRKVSSSKIIDKVFTVLKAKQIVSKEMWSRRAQGYEEKITSGDICSIAEVVRDLYKAEDAERSYSERNIYESALERLTSEISAAEAIDKQDALSKVLEVLAEKEFA